MFCSSCGQAAEPSDRFCGSCGAPNQGERPAPTAYQNSNLGAQQGQTSGSGGPKSEKNGLATAALVIGLVSAGLFEFIFVPLVAVIISSFALSKAQKLTKAGATKPGTGKSVAGLVLGIVYLMVSLFYMAGWN